MSFPRAFDGRATQFNILTVACGLSVAPGNVWWIWAGKEKVICQTLSPNCMVFWKLQVRAAWATFLSLTSSETELCHVIKLSAALGRYLDFWWELLAHAWGALVGLYQHHCKTHTNELCCNYHMKTSLGWVNQQRMEIPDKHKWATRMFIPVATMPLFPTDTSLVLGLLWQPNYGLSSICAKHGSLLHQGPAGMAGRTGAEKMQKHQGI